MTETEIGQLLLSISRNSARPSLDFVDAGLVTQIPELKAMLGVPQDPRWHPEGDVLSHSLAASQRAADICEQAGVPSERREIVVFASLFHDVGKPNTTVIEPGRIRSRGHAEVGAGMLIGISRRLNIEERVAKATTSLVATHMAALSVEGAPTERAVRRLISLLDVGGASLEDWAIVVRADRSARAGLVLPDLTQSWISVARRLPGYP